MSQLPLYFFTAFFLASSAYAQVIGYDAIVNQKGTNNTIDLNQHDASDLDGSGPNPIAIIDQEGSDNSMNVEQAYGRARNRLPLAQAGQRNRMDVLATSGGLGGGQVTQTGQQNGMSLNLYDARGTTIAQDGVHNTMKAANFQGVISAEQTATSSDSTIDATSSKSGVGIQQAGMHQYTSVNTAPFASVKVTQHETATNANVQVNAGVTSFVNIEQSGADEIASVGSPGGTTAYLKADIIQRGTNTEARISQPGFGNAEASILQDSGSDRSIAAIQVGGSSEARILQAGHDDNAVIRQDGLGSNNEASIKQYEFNDVAAITQLGSNNVGSITQLSPGNTAILNQSGGSTTHIVQR